MVSSAGRFPECPTEIETASVSLRPCSVLLDRKSCMQLSICCPVQYGCCCASACLTIPHAKPRHMLCLKVLYSTS